eukprot:3885009-Alexandrium_andersonii.AAC.1
MCARPPTASTPAAVLTRSPRRSPAPVRPQPHPLCNMVGAETSAIFFRPGCPCPTRVRPSRACDLGAA